MPKKNKIILIVLGLSLLIFSFVFVLKHAHQVKWMALRIAVKILHIIEGRSNPTRYNAITPVPYQDGVAIFVASSLDRIFQDGKTLLKPRFTSSASLDLAKNEYRSFQIVLQTQDRELDNVTIAVSDLINSSTGKKLGIEDVSVRTVGYVQTLEPYYPVKYVGLWPDPLLPATKTHIKSHTTQPFWVTVYMPVEAVAGEYTGNITVLADDKTLKKIPFSVHVYDFILPKTSHLKTAFDFYGHITKLRFPQADDEEDSAYYNRINKINDRFILTMLQYRMNPVLNVDPTSPTEMANVDRYIANGLNNFSVGKYGGTYNNNWPESTQSIEDLFSQYQTYGEDLKLNDILSDTYIYLWDEGVMGNPQVAKVASMVHRAYPDLKTMVCYHGIWDPADGADWIKDIDIWTFQIDNFDEQKMRKLQNMGKEMWMYVSGPAGADTPNLAMDFDSIDYRIIPWLCWKYNIQGFLYWCVNWWPLVDPFENARNSQWAQNGNGLLFYPGKNGPLASLRVELFRDGMEDYEYIQFLFEDLKILKDKNLVKANQQFFNESVKLLTMDNSIATSMSKFTRDDEILDNRRNAIAHQIEKFNSLLVP